MMMIRRTQSKKSRVQMKMRMITKEKIKLPHLIRTLPMIMRTNTITNTTINTITSTVINTVINNNLIKTKTTMRMTMMMRILWRR